MRSRVRLAITTAAVAVVAVLFIATPGAVATQSQPVLAGAQNTENFETLIVNTTKVSLNDCLAVNANADSGLVACGSNGVQGLGSGSLGYGVYGRGFYGVRGSGAEAGVEGFGPQGVVGTAVGNAGGTGVVGYSSTGDGVLGQNTGSTGVGVHGLTAGLGSAVFGEATSNGVGVVGKSTNGIGVTAQSDATQGTALKATALHGSGAKAVWGVSDSGYGGYFSAPTLPGIGVFANGGAYAVYGTTQTGTGLYGVNTGPTGIGVNGKTYGSGSGVYGEAVNNGVAVFGKTTTGTALRGDSPNGIALQVNGKAKFSRSGITTVPAGTAALVVSLSGTSSNSIVTATAQQNTSVFVKAVVPAAGSFTIYLTGNAPASGLKVAYFVLN
jgi:hypothetical protein